MSTSSETAATYAFLYSTGREALTHVLKLYRRFAAAQPEFAANPELAR